MVEKIDYCVKTFDNVYCYNYGNNSYKDSKEGASG